MILCETCGGEGTVIEFRRFAGEYQAGEPVEVMCPDCEGAGECDSDDPDDSGKPLSQWIAEQEFTEVVGDPFKERDAA